MVVWGNAWECYVAPCLALSRSNEAICLLLLLLLLWLSVVVVVVVVFSGICCCCCCKWQCKGSTLPNSSLPLSLPACLLFFPALIICRNLFWSLPLALVMRGASPRQFTHRFTWQGKVACSEVLISSTWALRWDMWLAAPILYQCTYDVAGTKLTKKYERNQCAGKSMKKRWSNGRKKYRYKKKLKKKG